MVNGEQHLVHLPIALFKNINFPNKGSYIRTTERHVCGHFDKTNLESWNLCCVPGPWIVPWAVWPHPEAGKPSSSSSWRKYRWPVLAVWLGRTPPGLVCAPRPPGSDVEITNYQTNQTTTNDWSSVMELWFRSDYPLYLIRWRVHPPELLKVLLDTRFNRLKGHSVVQPFPLHQLVKKRLWRQRKCHV